MDKGIERINKMLELAHTNAAIFPPTILYNEGWMLRILLSLQSEGMGGVTLHFSIWSKVVF
ncbi:MAG: hypothetical protein NWE89_07695 [Candidatus Bathyarchaeota archaeon]|nr:hypothetical protein [Candidatus Bathyarchaeota archaeon]